MNNSNSMQHERYFNSFPRTIIPLSKDRKRSSYRGTNYGSSIHKLNSVGHTILTYNNKGFCFLKRDSKFILKNL